jgi:histidinol phosphatase-like enzyme (inositol monophosphatase family)
MSDEYLAFMHILADASGRAILPFFRTALATENKAKQGLFDPVTMADRSGEAAIRALIAAHYPAHGVIGEEFGIERPDAEHVWVLDPIDGTRSFVSGMPIWGTLIALLRNGEVVAGLLDQPFLNERFWGDGNFAIGRGPQGEKALSTRRPVAMKEAVIWVSASFPRDPIGMAAVERLRSQVRMINYGSDCYAMAMLAEGHIDAVIETKLEIYDIAAHIPILQGAGGTITALDGGPALKAGAYIATGDPALHAPMLALLRGQDGA